MAVAAPGKRGHVDLAISGMTCASCAARVEKRLNKLESVRATVNFASEQAAVAFDPAIISLGDLIGAVEGIGYRAAVPEEASPTEDPARPYRLRLVLALAASVPVALWAWVAAARFAGWEWSSLAVATPVVAYAGWPFHRAAAQNACHGVATMDTLISLGTLAAWTWSVVVLAAGMKQGVYFDTATLVTALVLLGRYIEARAKRRSGEAVRALVERGAKEAHVLRDGQEVLVPIEALRVGDVFVVRPGEKVATDGVVTEGSSALDCSVLTGEPVPVEVGPGAEVAGGTVNASGRLVVRATKVGSETALAQIARLVAEAQTGKAQVQRLADRVSAVFVPVVIGLALLTLAGWLVFAGSGTASAFTAAVAVVVVACPCALGLATPTALMVGAGRGAQLGIVIKGPQVLEQTRKVTTVVLDKTGTLTEGKMRVGALVPAEGVSEEELLRLAAAVEGPSEHPIARAVAEEGRHRVGLLPPAEGFDNRAGLGVEAVVEGHAVVVGRPALLSDWAVHLPEALASEAARLEEKGTTVVAVASDGRAIGLVALADRVKTTARRAVCELKELGLTPVLLTGDNERTARAVAAEVGIERVLANVLPDAKAAEVRRLQEAGEVVAMVGDGVNDAPALAQADLGLSIGTGTDVAIEASDLTLVLGDLRSAADAIRLARKTLATIKGNLFWAFAYNLVAVPLAIAGVVNPIVAAGAMAFSSVFVVSNSLRLRRFRPARVVL
jgi:Cu+-exporting ATPase